jgi:microcystin-dependent protein
MPMNPYIGEISMSGFNFPPAGYAACNGELLAISQNVALFSLLGTQFGGNGTSNFALPDLQGRVPVGSGAGARLTQRIIGEAGGEETVTLTAAQMPAHSHAILASAVPANAQSPAGTSWAETPDHAYATSAPAAAMNAASIASAGGGTAHDNMPPFLVVNYYIALLGIFPSQN